MSKQYFNVIDPEDVMHIVCHIKGVNQDFLFNGRQKILVQARQMTAYFMRKYCYGRDWRFKTIRYKRLTVTDIGLLLQQDHSTVLYAIKCIERDMKLYADLRKEMEMVDDIIRKFRFIKEKEDMF